jgi:PAS domain S-box
MTSDEQPISHRSPDLKYASSLDQLPLHSTDLLTLLDPKGIILYESPSIERLYGYDQDGLVGEQVADYFHPEDCDRVVEALATVVSDECHHPETIEYRHLQADGSYKWIESVGSSTPTPDGNYVINSRDISSRKQRERDLQRAHGQVQSERDGKEAIRQLLLETSTDREVASSACRVLVDDYGYEAARVVRKQRGHGNEPRPQVVADYGSDRVFQRSNDGGVIDRVARQALTTDAPVTVTTETSRKTDLVDQLERSGLHSVRSVPVAHEGLSWGTLTVAGAGASNDVAQELVDEVAAALAFKHQVSRQQKALRAKTVTEIGLRIQDGHVLAALAAAPSFPVGASLTVEELWQADGELSTYLAKTGVADSEIIVDAASRLPAVREAGIVTESDERAVVQLKVDKPTVGEIVGGHGGVLQSTTVIDGQVDMLAQFTRRTDLTQVVETLRDHWPATRLYVKSERTVDSERTDLFEGLTCKQKEALRAATFLGFFHRPQQANAGEVAKRLDISRSTFLYHLRTAERKMFIKAFGADSTDANGYESAWE